MLWKPSVGIEISGKDLKVVVVEKLFKRQRLAKTEVVAAFLALPENERLRVFTAFARKHRLPPSRVFLTLPKETGIVRQMEFPVEVADKAASAAALQVETISPWPRDELYWSCSFERPSKGSKSLRATIVIIPRATLDPWIEFFSKTGLPLSGASISSSTWAHGAAVFWGSVPSTMVLGCEQGFVEGVLVSGGQLLALTSEGDNVSFQARSVVERLLSLGRIESPDNVKLFAHGSVAQDFNSDAKYPPLERAGSNLQPYFGAIATALLGLRRSAFNVNLVPATLRYRHNRILLAPTFLLALLAVLFSIAWFVRAPYQTLIYAEQIDREIRTMAPQVKDVSGLEADLEKLNRRFITLSNHFRDRDSNLEVLRELSRILPSDTWISSYAYQGSSVSISGLSNSAAQTQKVLEDSPVFKDAQLSATITKDPSGKDRFSIRVAVERAQ